VAFLADRGTDSAVPSFEHDWRGLGWSRD